MSKPFLVGSQSAKGFLGPGIEVLKSGGSAMDAVEAAIWGVEANPDDHSVGLGGIPNLLGVIQLDASIMDGESRDAGAVASLEGFLHPISVARKVLEVSPHALLVGEGAGLFAEEMGFERTELHTEYSREFHRAFREGTLHELGEEFALDLSWLEEDRRNYDFEAWYRRFRARQHGTVNVMAVDARGDICSGVSTSGTYLKFPGRVGDSPIIGAGNYCDNRYGAAACTGSGELAIRLSTARTIVAYIESGDTVGEACVRAMRDVRSMVSDGFMTCLAFDVEGNVASASTGEEPRHYYMDVESVGEEERIGVLVKA